MKCDITASGDDLEGLSFIAENLALLKQCIKCSQEFTAKFNRHLNHSDRLEMATIAARHDEIYWRLFEKFIKKVRGL
jgi:hypothetical protein